MQSKFKHVPNKINFLFTLLNQMSGLLNALKHIFGMYEDWRCVNLWLQLKLMN